MSNIQNVSKVEEPCTALIDSNNKQNVSKAEWLCAALIDFLPIPIIGSLIQVVYYTADTISYWSTEMGSNHFVWHASYFQASHNLNYVLYSLGTLYLLLKDTLGPSLGKRIMGLRLQKEGNDVKKPLLCILRNALLAFSYGQFISHPDLTVTSFMIRNTFFIYCIAELACVCTTHKTIGDHIMQLELVRAEDFTPGKVNNRTYCIITIILMFAMTSNYFMPNLFPTESITSLGLEQMKKISISSVASSKLIQAFGYAYLFNKLIQPKAFRWTAIILIILLHLGFLLKVVVDY